MKNKIKRGTVGDIVNFDDGEMLVIDGIIEADGDSFYCFNTNELHSYKLKTDDDSIVSILHTVSTLDVFDRYYLEATEYLATARRFIHDNALDEAADNLLALKTMSSLMIDVVSILDRE